MKLSSNSVNIYHITNKHRVDKILQHGIKINQKFNEENMINKELYEAQRFELDSVIDEYFHENNLNIPIGFTFFFKKRENIISNSMRRILTIELPTNISNKCFEADKDKSDILFNSAEFPDDWESIENARYEYKKSIRPFRDYRSNNYKTTEIFCPFNIDKKYIKKIE